MKIYNINVYKYVTDLISDILVQITEYYCDRILHVILTYYKVL